MADVLFTKPAEYDLIDIEYNIAFDLENIQASDRIVDGIVDEASKLSLFPKKHQLVNDTLLSSLGLRMTYFEDYNIFYDEETDVVYIIRILYENMDWKNILKP